MNADYPNGLRGSEPGLDLHDWQSVRASVEADAEGDPDAAVSQLADLVHRMLLSRGYDVDDPVAREGDEPEVVVGYLAARETAERAEVGAASRADVETALEDLRSIFDTLAVEHPRRVAEATPPLSRRGSSIGSVESVVPRGHLGRGADSGPAVVTENVGDEPSLAHR